MTPLVKRMRARLDPQHESPPAAVGAPVDYGADPVDPTRTAVVVCHGMGQQVRFETLNDIVQVVRGEARRRGEQVVDVVSRLVLFRDGNGDCIDQLGRVELTISGGGRPDRTVHLYEAYWAPLTEGKVVLRDVMWFLLYAGINGILAAIRGFRRLMFNRWVDLPVRPAYTTFLFVFALAVVLSLIVINTALGLIITSRTLTGGQPDSWPSPALVHAVVGDIYWAEIVAIPLALIVGMLHYARNVYVGRTRGEPRRFIIPKPVEWLLVGWVWIALVATIASAASIVYHMVVARPTVGDGVPMTRFIVIAGIAFLTSYILRSFFIQYLGDVVVYLSGHAVSRFDEIRTAIQTIGVKVGRAVYGSPQYATCVLVGHSLGSVVAYDLYNRLVNEQPAARRVRERTALFLTFGSPLDKTAFVFRSQSAKDADVREALAGAIQPVIADPDNRPRRWVNVWSTLDWISGPVDYYHEPPPAPRFVENLEDPDARIPLVAHTHYWANSLLARTLYDAL